MNFEEFTRELADCHPEGENNLAVRVITLAGEIAEFLVEEGKDGDIPSEATIEELGDCFAAAVYLRRLAGGSGYKDRYCLLSAIADLNKYTRDILIYGIRGLDRVGLHMTLNKVLVMLKSYDYASSAMEGAVKKQRELWFPQDLFDLQFKCPKCGSFMFGSSTNSDGSLTRNCHGNEKWKCEFEFHESEDGKYFGPREG